MNSESLSSSAPGTSTPLAGKVALVTGASRGIGRAIAVRLAQDGAAVMLVARSADDLAAAVREIENSGGRAAFLARDLREEGAAPEVVEATAAKWGGVDLLINNAGATKRGEFAELTDEEWADGFALKFFGAVRLARAAWPSLAERGGSIVNIAGIGGRTPGAQFALGGSVNAALLSLTKSLAETGIRDGVQVNAINPGSVRTDRLTKRLEMLARERGIEVDAAAEAMAREARITRFGEPEEVAGLVSFLVSAQGRFLQGALIDMDGGETKTI